MDLIKIQMLLGLLNLFFLLLISCTCRCMGFHKLTQPLMQKEWYLKIYGYHCYFWYGLFLSVLIHTIIGIYLFGLPF